MKNIDPLVAIIVSEHLATLRDLSEYYTLEEMYQMYEIIHVDKYNGFARSMWQASCNKKKGGRNIMRFVS